MVRTRTRYGIGILLLTACMLVSLPSCDRTADRTGTEASSTPGALPTPSAGIITGGIMEVASAGRFLLRADLSTGGFLLTDSSGGNAFASVPDGIDDDPLAKGRYRMMLSSRLMLRYVTGFEGTVSTAYSAAYSDEALSSRTPDGFRTEFRFRSLGILVPVEYSLDDHGLVVTVDTEEIVETGPHSVTSVSLLPSFLTGRFDEEGYLFVPDGCGALIRFDNGKSGPGMNYSQPVYGVDPTRLAKEASPVSEPARLPVFGVSAGSRGLLAIIEEGASLCSIEAGAAGTTSSFANVYPTFQIRAVDSYQLGNDKAAVSSNIYQKGAVRSGQLRVRYVPLSGSDAGYVGMAKTYRSELIRRTSMEPVGSGRPLYLEIHGAVEIPGSILGIPTRTQVVLSDFDQAASMLARWKDAGVEEVVARYVRWNDDGIRRTAPFRGDVSRSLGGAAGLDRLLGFAREAGYRLYLDCDPLYFEKTAPFRSKTGTSALLLSKIPAVQRAFLLSTQQPDPSIPWGYHTRLSELPGNGKAMQQAGRKTGAGIASSILGSLLYSDYRDPGSTRVVTEKTFTTLVSELVGTQGPLFTEGGNAWILPYADHVAGVPTGTSGYDLCDASVPFYQIALQGLVSMSTAPVNRSSDPRQLFLKAVETGISLDYSLFARNPIALKDTRYSGLYGSYAPDWLDEAAEDWKELDGIFGGQPPGRILDHRPIAEGVFETDFDNGWTVRVNYTDKDFLRDGTTTGPRDYLAWRTR